MTSATGDPEALLHSGLESGRIHSAYLLSGPGDAPRSAALRFVRALVCEGGQARPCEDCSACRRSLSSQELKLDGKGRKGPLYRHVGDHPDLLWIERGPDDTRVRIGQIRALQNALRLRIEEGRRRAAVVADAEWLNQEAQNALLRLLEEPPPRTTLVLVAASSAGLLATVRSRCQRIPFRSPPRADRGDDSLLDRFEQLDQSSLSELLDWAEECRGARTSAAARAERLLATASAWLRARVQRELEAGRGDVQRELVAFDVLKACRKALAQRNANPQMVAERAWLALREAATR
jgi:DNA polymerase III delta prime subunit